MTCLRISSCTNNLDASITLVAHPESAETPRVGAIYFDGKHASECAFYLSEQVRYFPIELAEVTRHDTELDEETTLIMVPDGPRERIAQEKLAPAA